MNNITNFLNQTYTAFSDYNNVSPSETTPTQYMSFLNAATVTAYFVGIVYLIDMVFVQRELNAACADSDRNKVLHVLRGGRARLNYPVFLEVLSKEFVENPLSIACLNASPEIIQILIQSGAKINAQNAAGFTALMKASNRDVVQLLIDNGADIHMKDRFGKTALHSAAFMGKTDVVEALITAGVDINAKDKDGFTALHCALMLGKKEVGEALIGAGADISVQTKSGFTPTDAAAFSGNIEIIKLLMQKGATIDVKKILHSAVLSKNIEMTKFFVNQGADINAQNDVGNTPLHICSFNRDRLDIAKYLIAKGADVNLSTKQGYTALDIAYMECNDELINVLTSKNAKYNFLPNKILYCTHEAFGRIKAIFHLRRA